MPFSAECREGLYHSDARARRSETRHASQSFCKRSVVLRFLEVPLSPRGCGRSEVPRQPKSVMSRSLLRWIFRLWSTWRRTFRPVQSRQVTTVAADAASHLPRIGNCLARKSERLLTTHTSHFRPSTPSLSVSRASARSTQFTRRGSRFSRGRENIEVAVKLF